MRKMARTIAGTGFAFALAIALGFGAQQTFGSGLRTDGCDGACTGPDPNANCATCCIHAGGNGGACFSGACICSGG